MLKITQKSVNHRNHFLHLKPYSLEMLREKEKGGEGKREKDHYPLGSLGIRKSALFRITQVKPIHNYSSAENVKLCFLVLQKSTLLAIRY